MKNQEILNEATPIENMALEVGVYTLGEHLADPKTGEQPTASERMAEIIKLGVEAERLGFDIFHVGESHQAGFISQAHLIILAAVAAKTDRIILNSATTVLNFNDPVRIYEDLATLDLISGGRVEAVIGKNSRVSSLSQLGYSLEDYEDRFEELFNLFLQLNNQDEVTWDGEFRQPLNNYQVLPKLYDGKSRVKVWRAVSGTYASAELVGQQGLPLYVSLIEHDLEYYRELIDVYRDAFQAKDSRYPEPVVAVTGLIHIVDENKEAVQPYLEQHFCNAFEHEVEGNVLDNSSQLDKPHYFGTSQEILDKIRHQQDVLEFKRIGFLFDFGGMPKDLVQQNMLTFSQEVLPHLR